VCDIKLILRRWTMNCYYLQTSEENAENANVNRAVFNVRGGGGLVVEGLLVDRITTTLDIISVSGSSSSATVSDATFTKSRIQRVRFFL
jgi:hypothetical protein